MEDTYMQPHTDLNLCSLNAFPECLSTHPPAHSDNEKVHRHRHTRAHRALAGPLCVPHRGPQSQPTDPRGGPVPSPARVISQERGRRGPTCQPAVSSSITAGALTFRAWHQDDRFRCNVPQIALTFGKYSTSGPIQLQTFFWKRREMAERAARACNVLKRNCFPAHTPGAEPLGLSASPPRDQGAPAASLPLP